MILLDFLGLPFLRWALRGMWIRSASDRLAFRVWRKCRRTGVEVPSLGELAPLFSDLDLRARLAHSDSEVLGQLRRGLVDRLPLTGEDRGARVDEIVEVVIEIASDARADDTRATNTILHQRVMPALDAIARDRSSSGGMVEHFYAFSGAIGPVLRAQLKLLVAEDPERRTSLSALSNRSERGARLRDWARSLPSHVNSGDQSLLMFLGDIAGADGETEVACSFYQMAQAAGGPASAECAYLELLWTRRQLGAGDVEEIKALDESPIRDATLCFVANDYAGARDLLSDISAPTESWHFAGYFQAQHLRVQALVGLQELSEAAALAQDVFERFQAPGFAVLAAEITIGLALHEGGINRGVRLESALELATRALELRREYGGDTVAAAAPAIGALIQLNNEADARQLLAGLPDPEAASADERISVLLDTDVRPASVPGTAPASRVANARDLGEIYDAARESALRGVFDEAALAAVAAAHPEAVDALRLVASAASGDAAARAELRLKGRTRATHLEALASLLTDEADLAGAGAVREAYGRAFRDPSMLHRAAGLHFRAAEFDLAESCARLAIAVCTPNWGGRQAAAATLIESLVKQGKFQEAVSFGRVEVGRFAEPGPALWATAYALAVAGEAAEAWSLVRRLEVARIADSDAKATLWIQLWGAEGDRVELESLLELLACYPGDKSKLRAAFPGLLRLPDGEEGGESDPRVAEAFRSALTDMVHEGVAEMITVDLDNPTATLDELASRLPDTTELEKKLREGQLPLGVVARATGATITATLLARSGSPWRTTLETAREAEVAVARSALGARVVIDLTALYSLACVESGSSEMLLSAFPTSLFTTSQGRDLGSSSMASSQKARAAVFRDADTGRARIVEYDDSIVNRRSSRIARMAGLAAGLEDVDEGTDPAFDDLRAVAGAATWLAAAEHAKSHGLPLWCDDSIVRVAARARGVDAFGTAALTEALLETRAIRPEIGNVVFAQLAADGQVGGLFRPEVLDFALAVSPNRAGTLIAHISHAAVNSDDHAIRSFIVMHTGRAECELAEVAAMTHAYAYWVKATRIEDYQIPAIASLVLDILQTHRSPASVMPFVIASLAEVLDGRVVEEDIVSLVAGLRLGDLSQRVEIGQASEALRAEFALTSERARSTVSRAILLS